VHFQLWPYRVFVRNVLYHTVGNFHTLCHMSKHVFFLNGGIFQTSTTMCNLKRYFFNIKENIWLRYDNLKSAILFAQRGFMHQVSSMMVKLMLGLPAKTCHLQSFGQLLQGLLATPNYTLSRAFQDPGTPKQSSIQRSTDRPIFHFYWSRLWVQPQQIFCNIMMCVPICAITVKGCCLTSKLL
jgi:hypothetical protein